MKKSLKEVGISDLYESKSVMKSLALLMAFVISIASIVYTNSLVKSLKEREERLIALYAKTIEYMANENTNDNLNFLNQEILIQNNSIPVILTDEDFRPSVVRNVDIPENLAPQEREDFLLREMEAMRAEYQPILITWRGPDGTEYGNQYVFYKNSRLIYQLKYYPYVQLSVIGVFAFLVYLAFNYSRRAEQNRVWVGLAKETAHQLGTPLSSLMAWYEYLKTHEGLKDDPMIDEINKDIHKLETITSRFSSIGSIPVLKQENVYAIIRSIVDYLGKRISSKVQIEIHTHDTHLMASINKPLFDWVIENICKNAVDAMSGTGKIDISISRSTESQIIVDIKDNGKGIPKSKQKQIFQPGFTTKKRGWGLGLTLAKRIIENYHKGKIFVKESHPDTGTTFRIILKSHS
ncbi:HAMP domain-containing sensor histidine kinase [Cytophagales bacterium LB-30]|uniref:histidine kinase n=1 Tax=Shiella aurantiaca TaxID=3058365 RepID=A0ABT8F2R8_9BACT|nr:HAMP domain-containing sensor histidine kinase [Shiella aurantiaca]MDN4164745.1 HAMP domain-containing sensor histidine kinase [Shiella aurantiaca]